MTTPTSGVLIGGMGVEIGAGLSRTRTGLDFIEIRFQEFDLGHSGSVAACQNCSVVLILFHSAQAVENPTYSGIANQRMIPNIKQ